MFVNDTSVYTASDNMNEIIQLVNDEINNLFKWLNNNYIQLNLSKTKMMILKNKNAYLNLVERYTM